MAEMERSQEAERKTGTQEGRARMNTEAFAGFVTELRREKGLTQKQLAEKLFVSNKAVSKWERGQSMPDISLLEPLAEVLGVTVSELLHGEKRTEERTKGEREKSDELTAEQIARLLEESEEISMEDRERRRCIVRKRFVRYLAEGLLAVAEVTLLYLFGGRLGFTREDISVDMLIMEPLILFIGIWPFFFMPEKLPPLYDKTRISGYSDGFFCIAVNGVYFNNRNWPHVTKALRTFCFWTPILWPAAYVPLRLIVPDVVWRMGRLVPILGISLGGLFVPMVVLAKKYE